MKWIFTITTSIIFGTVSFGQINQEKEITLVVEQFFVAMKSQDTVLLKSLLKKDVVFFTIYRSKEVPKLLQENAQEFITAVGTPHKEIWDERISNISIHQDGELASVWMDYEFYLDDEFLHCGVNVMQLFFNGNKWMIFEIADTRRKDGCQ